MVGRYKPYAKYRDSTIEWIGKVPEHWNASYLGFECSVKARLGWKGLKAEEYVDDGYVFLATPNIKDNEIDFVNVNRITKERYDESPEIMLEKGDVLVTKDGSTTGTTNIIRMLPEPTTVNSSIAVLRNKGNVLSEYLYYFFVSEYTQNVINRMRGGMGVPHLFQADLRKFFILIPAKQEQELIANFLDYETSKIDTLIEKQQQLIQLLKEKRQAVISHAVTKGLNPNVEIQDSDVECLGLVPKHWEVKNLRHLGFCQNGINIGAEYFGSGFPFVSYGDAYKNEVLPKNASGLVQSSESDRRTYSVITGDVIFTRTSETIDEIGLSSTCLSTIRDASFAGFLIRFRPKNNILNANFSKYYFRNILLRAFFIREMNLVTRASLSQDLLKKLPVPLPPLDEQKQIAQFLDDKSAIFSKLIENAESAIVLSKERRTALISAAVTGKIDVRNWVAPKETQTNKEVTA
jgi:type I restriction enzyme S subunit